MEVDLTDSFRLMIVGMDVGERIPSERALAEHFGVSRATVKRALLRLSAQGWLSIEPGFCPRVAKPKGTAIALERLLEVEPELHNDLQQFVQQLGTERSILYPTSARKALEKLDQLTLEK